MTSVNFPGVRQAAAEEYQRLGYSRIADVPAYIKVSVEWILIPTDNAIVKPVQNASGCLNKTLTIVGIAAGAFVCYKAAKACISDPAYGAAVMAERGLAFGVPVPLEPHPHIHFPASRLYPPRTEVG